MLLIINNKDTYIKYRNYVDFFEVELYLTMFPNENEREPFENIVDRIVERKYPYTQLIIIIENNAVCGGCVSDYYPECNSIEPIYLCVGEEYRGKGIAKKLLSETFKSYDGIKHMFVEVDNPLKVDMKNTKMDPNTRIEIYKKLGFQIIPINYIQPPLDTNSDYEFNLLLMPKGEAMDKQTLKDFLFHFYRGLNHQDSEYLYEMYGEINITKII